MFGSSQLTEAVGVGVEVAVPVLAEQPATSSSDVESSATDA
jgi:hypothetical protein